LDRDGRRSLSRTGPLWSAARKTRVILETAPKGGLQGSRPIKQALESWSKRFASRLKD
jgi:hypothetical protein